MTLKLRQLRSDTADFEAEFQRLLHWSAETDQEIEQRVAQILADVRTRGDAAVLEYTARFDGVQAASVAALELGRDELRAAFDDYLREFKRDGRYDALVDHYYPGIRRYFPEFFAGEN